MVLLLVISGSSLCHKGNTHEGDPRLEDSTPRNGHSSFAGSSPVISMKLADGPIFLHIRRWRLED